VDRAVIIDFSQHRVIVSVSGGKDSAALYALAVHAFGAANFEAVFADTGHEHPVTYNYVRNLPDMAGGPPVEWVKGDFSEKVRAKGKEPSFIPFLDLMLMKGRAPSPKAQFCTEYLKLQPIRDWLRATADDREPVMLVGIRAGESARRAQMPMSEWSTYYDGYICRPILHLDEAQVFGLLERYGVPPNPLYGLGFTRVGCFPCIHSRKSELARLPEWAWAKLEEWEARVGSTWFPPGIIPGIQGLTRIQDVRYWCRTRHGGRELDEDAPDSADAPSCMATWGVCE
jgi:3'-phosphoadenosine 5'-phosphosulfate sulfotransferase (PAPS reductase)/FAD synthetase